MEILEAFDLTESLRDAAELAGCSHHTVARYVTAREEGALSDQPAARPQLIDEFRPKLEEWIERAAGKLRADVIKRRYDRLSALADELCAQRAEDRLGSTVDVLIDSAGVLVAHLTTLRLARRRSG